MTKENKNWTSFKNFASKLNLNHNIYIKQEEEQQIEVESEMHGRKSVIFK